MSIVSQKEKVFGNIGALRTLTNDFPTLKINNSFLSINNGGNAQQFLIDLVISLVGFEELRNTLVDVLVYATEEAEVIIKDTLKSELKGLVSCGVDAGLPTWIRSTGPGIVVPLKDIDFFNILKVNPISLPGGLIYEDIPSGINSSDYNTFLYYTVQNSPNVETWDNTIRVSFSQNPISPSTQTNVVQFNAHQSYNNKKLADLNNDYIDSLSLFASETLITNIIENLFGSLSVQVGVNKTESELELEGKISKVIDCILNSEDDSVFDDSFFEFSNAELADIKETAWNRRHGIKKLKTCSEVAVDMPINNLVKLKDDIANASTKVEQKEVISNAINQMAEHTSTYTGVPQDKYSIQIDFLQAMLSEITKVFVNAILGPKIISIFLLNYKIVYGQNSTYGDPIDFLKKNKTLLKNVVDRIRDMMIQILLTKVLKHITRLIAKNQVSALKEKANAQLAIILSLVGIPQNVIRLIRENSPISVS